MDNNPILSTMQRSYQTFTGWGQGGAGYWHGGGEKSQPSTASNSGIEN